jgi:hypothetical protein
MEGIGPSPVLLFSTIITNSDVGLRWFAGLNLDRNTEGSCCDIEADCMTQSRAIVVASLRSRSTYTSSATS